MHPPGVVTRLVVPQREELAERLDDRHARACGPFVGLAAAASKRRDEVMDARSDDDLGGAADRPGAAHQPARVRDRDERRADDVTAPVPGRDPVAGFDRCAGREGHDREPGRATTGVDALGDVQPRAGSGGVPVQDHATFTADGGAARVHRALERQGHPVTGDPEVPEAEEQSRAERQRGERIGCDQTAADEESARRPGERPSPAGELRSADSCFASHRGQPDAPGTGRRVTIRSSTSSDVTPRSSASGVTIIRWVRTAAASVLTSSGIT